MKHALHSFLDFFRKNTVMTVALVAAVLTTLIVHPDAAYAAYPDYKTLTCLFCVLAVVCALKHVRFFYLLADRIVRCFRTARSCVLALVFITFLGSMLIANDMALLTFLPLGYLTLTQTHKEKYMAFTFIMQNIAANLGGMLTPFGNPQNLFLYTKFQIPTLEFMQIMLIPFLLSIAMIIACCLIFVRPEPLESHGEPIPFARNRTLVYLLLFALSIAIVFRTIPYYLGLAVIVAALIFADRHALQEVDYPLLLTFVFFFIFAGNMGRIGFVRDFFAMLLEKNPLLVSVLSCQCISNVPSAILLSQFTDNYPALLIGVNIGGAGTPIASLASLITLREYTHHNPGKTGRYLLQFLAFNFAFLAILTVAMLWIL